MGNVCVIGGSLSGLAVAARLAKVGHSVTIVEESSTLGGRWRRPETWPTALCLPSAWRDLFRKTGRPLPATLAAHGLDLVEAPATRHFLPDGTKLTIPTERGAQTRALADAFGEAVANGWRNTIDRWDRLWQVLRPLGYEEDRPVDRDVWRELMPRLTLLEASRLVDPRLAPLVLDTAAPHAAADVPAWAMTAWSIDRLFGRWQLVDVDRQEPVPPTTLLDLLVDRVGERGVQLVLETRLLGRSATEVRTSAGQHHFDAVVDATSPFAGLGHIDPSLEPALTPTIRTRTVTTPLPPHVDHVSGVATHSVRTPTGWLEVVRDLRRPEMSPDVGVRWAGANSWRRRPPIEDPSGVVNASAAQRAGGEPWALLLTAALASYAVHERLTGQSIRPSDDPRLTPGGAKLARLPHTP